MKKGWEIKRLPNIAEYFIGLTYSPKDVSTKGIIVLRSSNIQNDELDLSDLVRVTCSVKKPLIVRNGDILMCSRNGSKRLLGKTAMIGNLSEEMTFGTFMTVIRSELNPYLSWFFRSEAFRDQIGVGENTMINQITKYMLDTIRVPVPPLPEQQRIVGILDKAFAGLAVAVANAEKNLQNARALFESHLQSVFTQRGEGWKMEKLDDLTELARGHNPPKSKFSREQKPGYVRFYQIRDGGTDDYTVYVPDSPQLHKMKKDDIMLVAYRHVGRAFRGVEGAFNVALCKISNARRDLLDDDYLFHIIPSPFVKGELLKRSERSLIPSMSIEHLRELRIPLPPLPEQQKIVKLINSLSTETQRLAAIYEKKLAALLELKKSLLHQAFRGEL